MAKKATTLEARVKDEYRLPSVAAFGGREYVKGAWRLVPPEQADSAGAHPFLDVREAGGEDATVAAAVTEPSPLSSSEDSPPASPAPSSRKEADEATLPASPPPAPAPRRGKSL